jgi:hypothetical protein
MSTESGRYIPGRRKMNKEGYKKILDRIKGETNREKQVSQLTRIVPKIFTESEINDYESLVLSQEVVNIERLIGLTAGEYRKIDRAVFEMFERLMERR